MDNENVIIYTIGYYLMVKKNKITKFPGKWMEPEIIILNEVTQKDKCFMFPLTCGF